MQAGLYVALAGQLVLERQLAATANNVANAGTVGYRAEGMHFQTLVSRASAVATAFPSNGGLHASEQAGALTRTGGSLDVAVQGHGYLAIQTPAGQAYTRDGRLQVLESGELVTLSGYPVLDPGGAPVTLDPGAADIAIGRDGMIAQGGRSIAAIGLFAIDLQPGFERYGNAALIPATGAQPISNFATDGFVQGFVEESNVNPVAEMTALISLTRSFENLAAGLDEMSDNLKSAIQTLAARA